MLISWNFLKYFLLTRLDILSNSYLSIELIGIFFQPDNLTLEKLLFCLLFREWCSPSKALLLQKERNDYDEEKRWSSLMFIVWAWASIEVYGWSCSDSVSDCFSQIWSKQKHIKHALHGLSHYAFWEQTLKNFRNGKNCLGRNCYGKQISPIHMGQHSLSVRSGRYKHFVMSGDVWYKP